MAPACGICNSSPSQMCKQCRSIHYCSSRCQKIDWPSHKLLCAQYKNDNERPSPSHRRAILFQDSEKQPKFIWIECQKMEEGGHNWEEPQNVQHHLGPDCGLVERTSFDRNKVRDRPLDHSIEIHNRNAFGLDGSVPTQSIIAATQGTNAHEWCGPVVVLRKIGHCSTYAGSFGDMSMEDYMHVIDHFKVYC